MKVACKINNIFDLKDSFTIERLKKYISLSDGQLNLEKNNEYCVYGVLFRDNSPWYYLCLDDDDESPSPYPAELFDIIDGRTSSYWRLATHYSSTLNVFSGFVIPDWSQDESFYENLIDGDPKRQATFSKYRKLMDKEFDVIDEEKNACIQQALRDVLVQLENNEEIVITSDDVEAMVFQLFEIINAADTQESSYELTSSLHDALTAFESSDDIVLIFSNTEAIVDSILSSVETRLKER